MIEYAHGGGSLLFAKFFILVFLVGIILFIVWAVKTLDKKQLKKWVISLLIVGALGMLISSFFGFKSWKKDTDRMGEKTKIMDYKDKKMDYKEKKIDNKEEIMIPEEEPAN